jgi:hypothetical protein
MKTCKTHHYTTWYQKYSGLVLKLKLKGYQFDTNEEIQAELQTVLDTLTEKDFQEAFQKWRSQWDWCLHVGGNYFAGDGSR